MNLQSLINLIKSQLLEIANQGLVSHDLSDLQEIRDVYLSEFGENRALIALSEKVESLLQSSNKDRVQCYFELNELIQKLSVSLAGFGIAAEGTVLELPESQTGSFRYNEVKNLQKALLEKSGSRLSLIRESLARGTYKARQLLPYYVENITESYGEVSQCILEEVLPFYGENAVPLVKEKLSFRGGRVQERILNFLLKNVSDVEKGPLLSEVLEKGDSELKKFVLKTADARLFQLEELKQLLSSRSIELRDLAQALIEKYS